MGMLNRSLLIYFIQGYFLANESVNTTATGKLDRLIGDFFIASSRMSRAVLPVIFKF